jgi:hypothetical protein
MEFDCPLNGGDKGEQKLNSSFTISIGLITKNSEIAHARYPFY